MKLLICGANGQLGYDCKTIFKDDFEVTGIDIDELDITDEQAVKQTIKKIAPDVLINCAAFTRVDDCEKETELAWKVNAQAPGYLANAMNDVNGYLIHVSTDYVFDGTLSIPQPYVESDSPNPKSYYGQSKLQGEKNVLASGVKHAIVRTAWLYGINGQNFLKTMLRLAVQNPDKEFKVINDQFGSPTWSFRLAEQLKNIVMNNITGICHATAEGYCSWYELAAYFLTQLGIEHKFIPCTTEEYPTPAVRPKNSILENSVLKDDHVNLMRDWQEDIDAFVDKYQSKLLEEIK